MGAIPHELAESDLTGLSDAELAAAFNTVYTDYVGPFSMSEESARQHIAAYAITRERSILWRDEDGAIVGLAALGVRGERGWVGGFGLAKDWRGRGLAGPLIDRLLGRAREAGLRRVQLEVITTNERAIRTYERVGFRRTRDLLHLVADENAAVRDPSATLEEVVPAPLLLDPPLPLVMPCWQRESASLIDRTDLRGMILGPRGAPRAYAVVTDRGTVAALSAIAGESAAALDTLLAALSTALPGRTLRIGNEPEESPVVDALLRAGWREPLRQHEMACDL